MLTSHEILARTGIKAVKTLYRWHTQGLIPKPTIGTHPNGRGKISYWDDWVLLRVMEIKQRVRQGQSLAEIAESLDEEGEAEKKKVRRRHSFQRAQENMIWDWAVEDFEQAVLDKVAGYIQQVGCRFGTSLYHDIVESLTYKTIKRLLEFVKTGFNPVLVIGPESVEIKPDFVVNHELAERGGDVDPLLAVPIRREFVDCFRQVAPDLPAAPSIGPDKQLCGRTDGDERARELLEKEFGEFKIVKSKRKKR